MPGSLVFNVPAESDMARRGCAKFSSMADRLRLPCPLAVRCAWLSFDTLGSEYHFRDSASRRTGNGSARTAVTRSRLGRPDRARAGRVHEAAAAAIWRQRLQAVLRRIVPLLRTTGVSDAMIHDLL